MGCPNPVGMFRLYTNDIADEGMKEKAEAGGQSTKNCIFSSFIIIVIIRSE